MKSPLPSWLDVLTIPLSWLYGAIVRVRNAHYDKQQNVKRVSLPVIAVGNVTVGGTGKSPLVRSQTRTPLCNKIGIQVS